MEQNLKVKEVDSYSYTRIIDLKVSKSMLIGNYDKPVFLNGHHTNVSTCCGKETLVRTVNFGRLQNVDVCDHHFNLEMEFIQSLINFDDSIEYIVGESNEILKGMSKEGLELMRKHKLSSDEKKRKKLEEEGQMRLF